MLAPPVVIVYITSERIQVNVLYHNKGFMFRVDKREGEWGSWGITSWVWWWTTASSEDDEWLHTTTATLWEPARRHAAAFKSVIKLDSICLSATSANEQHCWQCQQWGVRCCRWQCELGWNTDSESSNTGYFRFPDKSLVIIFASYL